MNKSVMKCCICNNENIGEFITINNKKYHLCCIERLQQENQKYKEEVEWTIGIVEHNRIISGKNKEIHQLKDN